MKLFAQAKSSSAALLLVVALCSASTTTATSSNIINNNAAITLPESRVTESVYRGQIKKKWGDFQSTTQNNEQQFGPIKTSEKATASMRGGAAAVKKRTGAAAVAKNRFPVDAISGIIAMGLIEAGLKKFFKATNINFPSQLGGCMVLFAVAVLAQLVHPGWGDCIHDFLAPGSTVLSKWLPAFFVPGLAMLPLAPSMGSGLDIAKAFAVVALGLVYSMSTITFSVLALRKAQGATNAAPVVKAATKPKRNTKAVPAPKLFPDETMNFLAIGSVASLVACVAAFRLDSALATPLQTMALIFSTLAGFVWAMRMPASITKVIHPLLTSSAVTVVMLKLIAFGIGSDLKSVLKSYKVGNLHPMKMGAGDVLLWLLGPSVVSFAVSMYAKKALIYENLLVIVTAILVASAGGLFGTAAFVRAISLGGSNGAMARLSILPRNVTTALAMVIADIVGGDISIAAVFVVFTGVFGATYGKAFLKFMGIHDPVTRGLGMGGAAQGLGVSAMSNEPDAFPFAAIAMVLTAVFATTIVSIPASRDLLINLATGDIAAAAAP